MPGLLRSERDDCWEAALPQGSCARPANMNDDKLGRRVTEDEQQDRFLSTNGTQDVMRDRQAHGDSVAFEASRVKSSASMENMSGQLPPEIEHITFGYLPLSQLVTRLVQDTFNGLAECINDMADLPVPRLESEENADTSRFNLQKKQRMLHFAQERRARFIKILVLSKWSQQAESISKVIDLRVWLESQRKLYDDACSWMGELKRIMESERMPNPDMITALEALSLGKAPGLPDLGYLAPQPLSPSQLLKALRRINTQLSIRLHLHESIPPAFRDHSIANGRVTFRVPNEFEVDLSIADEDPSSQLYFLDLRFLFSPTLVEIPQGHLRGELEHRINEVLSHDGLRGCSHFLHDFVLSHKLDILRHQAYRLSQEKWSEHLKVEAVHRSLIVQYWISRPGGRNWIELGIRRWRARKSSWFRQEEENESHIGIRWFRAGQEMKDITINFNLEQSSVEAILNQIISAHTDLILKETTAKLRESHVYSRKTLRLKHTRSVAKPAESRLFVQLTSSQSCTVVQEPVTGKLAIMPASTVNSRVERELNGLVSPENGVSSRIAQLRAIAACDEIEHLVRCQGWEIVNSMKPSQETLRQHFGADVLRVILLRRRSWNVQWLLALTPSLAGDVWWVVELHDRKLQRVPSAALGLSIRTAFKMPANEVCASGELSIAGLSWIERTAASLISQFTDSRQLSIQDLPHRLVKHMPKRSPSGLPILHVRFPDERAQKFQRSCKSPKFPWNDQTVRILFMGIDATKSLANHLVVAQRGCTTLRSQSLESIVGGFIKFHPISGAFAFRLSTPVGQSTIPAILDRLARVQRLIDYVSTLQAFELEPHNLSLGQLEFSHAASPRDCRTKISFIGDEPPQISLNHGNPHLRIQDQLTTLFRKANGLNQVVCSLQLTLPLMRAFMAIEATDNNNEVDILPRSIDWYHVRYQNPPARFDLRLRKRRDNLVWFLQQQSLEKDGKQDQRLQDQLESMIKGRGEGWIGVKPGLVATVNGVEALLKRINDVFQQVRPAEPAPTGEKQDFKGQKRKAEDSDVVVLD
ncbi:MAG: hypothetical protein Q9170_000710 [Blastenia crenularia]